jgi:hypothetical protein
MKFTPKRAPSAAELRLTEAQAAREAAQAEMEAAQTVLARLETAARAPAPIAAEIVLLDKDDAAAMSAWSVAGEGPAPLPDAERLSDLLRRLDAAEAQSRSAQGAMGAPRAAMNAAGIRAAAAQRAAYIAAKLVAIEEAEATLGPLKSAIAQIYEAKRRVDTAREGVLAGLAPAEDTREIFIALAEFDAKRKAAESIPMTELRAPDGAVPDGAHACTRPCRPRTCGQYLGRWRASAVRGQSWIVRKMSEAQSFTIANRFRAAQAASQGKPGVINLTPAPGEELVRVVCGQGADELNLEGKSYRRRDDGGFRIPRRHLDFALRNIGGFTEQALAKAESLRTIATAIHEMQPCNERDALSQSLADLFPGGAE